MRRAVSAFLLLLLTVNLAAGQSLNCAAWMTELLARVDQSCLGKNRNTLCYGNMTLSVEPRVENSVVDFSEPGDVVSLKDIESLRMTGFDPAVPEWGIALMHVQATLPATLPGQNVTVVLFGDVMIEDKDSTGHPMQSFYLSTGIGAPRCNAAPESGILIQTPDGAGIVEFEINDTRIQLGSTIFVQAAPNQSMVVTLLEGHASVTVGDREVILVPGTQAVVALDDAGLPASEPVGAVPEDPAVLDLPVALLPDNTFPLPDLETVIAPVTQITRTVSLVVPDVLDTVSETTRGALNIVGSALDKPVLDTVTDTVDFAVDTVTESLDTVTQTVSVVTAPIAVVVPVVEILPTVAAPVVEIIPTVVAPVVEIVPTVVQIVPTVVAPVVQIIPTLLPVLPPLIPTNLPLLGGLLNP